MKKNLLEIYALAVCFVTVVCAVFVTGIGLYDLLEISKPEFTLASHQYQRYQSNEAFYSSECEDGNKKKLTEEEITKKRLAAYDTALKSEQRDAVQSLVKAFIVLVLDVLVFLFHWRLARRSRETANAT